MADSLEKQINEQRNTMSRSEFLKFVKKVGIVGLVSMLFSGKLPRNSEKLLPEYSPNPSKGTTNLEQNTVSPDQIALESIIEHFQPQIAEIAPELHDYAEKAIYSLRNGTIPIEPATHLATPELVVAYALLKLIIRPEITETEEIVVAVPAIETISERDSLEQSLNSISTCSETETAKNTPCNDTKSVSLFSLDNSGLYSWISLDQVTAVLNPDNIEYPPNTDNPAFRTLDIITRAFESRNAAEILKYSIAWESNEFTRIRNPKTVLDDQDTIDLQVSARLAEMAPILAKSLSEHKLFEQKGNKKSNSESPRTLSDSKSTRIGKPNDATDAHKRNAKLLSESLKAEGKLTNITERDEIAVQKGEEFIRTELADKLADFKNKLPAELRGKLWVQEGFPPSYLYHKNKCHYLGTCLDVNIKANLDATSIVLVLEKAIEAGLDPVFETKNANIRAKAMALSNLPREHFLSAQDAKDITGQHFSFYDRKLAASLDMDTAEMPGASTEVPTSSPDTLLASKTPQ